MVHVTQAIYSRFLAQHIPGLVLRLSFTDPLPYPTAPPISVQTHFVRPIWLPYGMWGGTTLSFHSLPSSKFQSAGYKFIQDATSVLLKRGNCEGNQWSSGNQQRRSVCPVVVRSRVQRWIKGREKISAGRWR